jgi:3-deoxy-D-manno-octulosonate 8-phosphate phosphatase (KDO 8-P phosphatase)
MLKLVILDIDGIMTDGKKYYDSTGTVQYKTFCDKDWTAIKRLRALGITVIFLTGDPFNKAIADNRKIDVFVNRQNNTHNDKSTYLPSICEQYNVKVDEIVFAGDDIFDVGLMKLVKSYCPSDAPTVVKKVCTMLSCNGGENFVMKMFDHLESMGVLPKFDFDTHMEKVYELDLKDKF